MPKIKDIKSREILDSRCFPTLETTVFLDNGISARAAVPSGASTGTHEALELRDEDKTRFNGKGVLKAIDNIQKYIKPAILGMAIDCQEKIDKKIIDIDGTPNKSKLGANSILSVSLAITRSASKSLQMPLYRYINILLNKGAVMNDKKSVVPMFNVINGGLHGCGTFNFQEFLFIPHSSQSFKEALRIGAEAYQGLKKVIKNKGLNYSVGDEGGFTPQLSTNEEVLELLIEAIDKSNFSYGKNINIGLDLAASSFYGDGYYTPVKNDKSLKKSEFIYYLVKFIKKYKLFSLEDGLFEDDWDGWREITDQIGKDVIIIGDDLLVTNEKRFKKAIEKGSCNGILIKPNQIGTLTETLKVIKMAKAADYKIIISHRSGETNDDFIADLAVGVGADFVKFGAPARGERVAKYNRLLEIYQKLDL